MHDHTISRTIPEPLTDRERTVLQLIADGFSNQEIADQLTVSLNTVKTHVKRILDKLDASRRTKAVVTAQSLGLLATPGPPSVSDSRLPAAATSFIGREPELAQVLELLDKPDCRLITFVGVGGIGKTRLAMKVAAHVQDNLGRQVAFVPLEGLAKPQDVVLAVAQAVGLPFEGRLGTATQLLLSLRDRTLLLILDNFEHLLEASSLVADILVKARGVTVLVTSSERLNLHGETVFPLGGLDYPRGEKLPQSYSAVRLFVQAAGRVRFGFEPTGEDLG